MTAVEWLIDALNKEGISLYTPEIIEQALEKEEEQKILLVEELKNYTKEAQCILGNDEREASEFVEIFNNTTFKSE